MKVKMGLDGAPRVPETRDHLARRDAITGLDPLEQRCKEYGRVDGFGDVVVHSCLKAPLFITGHGMRRHGDNGNSLRSS